MVDLGDGNGIGLANRGACCVDRCVLPFPTSLAFTPCSLCFNSLCLIANILRCSSNFRCEGPAGVVGIEIVGVVDEVGEVSFFSFSLSLSLESAFAFSAFRASLALCSSTTLAISAGEGDAGAGVDVGIKVTL